MKLMRRSFLARSTASVGAMALGTLLGRDSMAAGDGAAPKHAALPKWKGVVRPLHNRAQAKRVIHLYMAGGPSHLETFDYKPKLAEMDGQPMPESLTKGQQVSQLLGQPLICLAPQWPFAQWGQSRQWINKLFPHLGALADELAVVRSMHSDQINHDPAHTVCNTGNAFPGRPSMGSWLTYGLGASAEDLPDYVVLTSVGKGGQAQPIASRHWGAGFLPSRFQGVEFRAQGDPVLYLGSPPGINRRRQRQAIDAIAELDRLHHEVYDDPETINRIAQYELAYRMQMSVPGLMDFSDESQQTLDFYGTEGADGTFAANCLMARRLAERNVRFIQVYHRAWDHHGAIKKSMHITAREVDQATAALIEDLKSRGMLEDTLIVFGGEFGRSPMSQGDSGRDHHMLGFSYMLCGGGIRGGVSYGATDELGYRAVENPTHIRDLHATILHLMGIDHRRLSVKFQGLDMRLTGAEHAHVIQDVLT
ncbi:DUF1501 domain-containing protein [Pirellulales bacterium]|nr:DUF1501 domain-containing protein [Pirellulales bacterium]